MFRSIRGYRRFFSLTPLARLPFACATFIALLPEKILILGSNQSAPKWIVENDLPRESPRTDLSFVCEKRVPRNWSLSYEMLFSVDSQKLGVCFGVGDPFIV